MPSLAQILPALTARLQAYSDTPLLDAQVLLAHLLQRPRTWVMAHPEAELSPAQQAALARASARLENGEPLPYVLGHWEFYGLDFLLSPAVLIPRPETELLVERALDWLRTHPSRRRAADVGVGSGCIAVALAVHTPELRLLAVDVSQPAVRMARRNAQAHNVAGRIHFLQADLLSTLRCQPAIDLLCANLPYIPGDVLRRLPIYGREPTLALDGGPDGLRLIAHLLSQAPAHMALHGLLLLEIEATQAQPALALAQAAFPQAQAQVLPDLAGRPRLLEISLS